MFGVFNYGVVQSKMVFVFKTSGLFLKDHDLGFLKVYIQGRFKAVLFQDGQVMLETITGWGLQNEIICMKQVSNLCVKECETWSC